MRRLVWEKDAVKTLKMLRDAAQRKILRKAIGKPARKLAKVVKGLTPVDTGTAKKSLATKIATSKRTKRTYAVIGPKTKHIVKVGTRTLRPSRYWHFIERRHNTMERALGSVDFQGEMTAEVQAEIEKVL